MRTAISTSVVILLIVMAAVLIRFRTARTPKEPPLTQGAQATETKSERSQEKVWEVPDKLKEISGIAYLDEHRFACVQDEEGTVFIYNTSDEKIEKEIPFGPKGDYEDLALAGNTIYVLQADGKLFSIEDFMAAKPAIREHPTGLTGFDLEGLCYDKSQNRLLLAVKEITGENSGQPSPVFAFDLGSLQLDSDPLFTVDLSGAKELENDEKSRPLKPSAIGIHPVTAEIYILEGVKPKLVILDRSGTPKEVRKLKGKEFTQPEGLAFSPRGTVFIANEGSKKRPGNIIEVVGGRY